MDQLHDTGHLGVSDLIGSISFRVIVRVKTGVDKNGWDLTIQEWPLIATAQQIGRVIVIPKPEFKLGRGVGLGSRSTKIW